MKQNQQTQPGTRETLRECEEPGSKYGPKHSQILEDRGTSYHNSAEETLPRGRSQLSCSARPSDSLGQSARRHLRRTSSVYGQSVQKWNGWSSETEPTRKKKTKNKTLLCAAQQPHHLTFCLFFMAVHNRPLAVNASSLAGHWPR